MLRLHATRFLSSECWYCLFCATCHVAGTSSSLVVRKSFTGQSRPAVHEQLAPILTSERRKSKHSSQASLPRRAVHEQLALILTSERRKTKHSSQVNFTRLAVQEQLSLIPTSERRKSKHPSQVNLFRRAVHEQLALILTSERQSNLRCCLALSEYDIHRKWETWRRAHMQPSPANTMPACGGAHTGGLNLCRTANATTLPS